MTKLYVPSSLLLIVSVGSKQDLGYDQTKCGEDRTVNPDQVNRKNYFSGLKNQIL